jgi:hypothetical protein
MLAGASVLRRSPRNGEQDISEACGLDRGRGRSVPKLSNLAGKI